jgi:acetamidase/formamidase
MGKEELKRIDRSLATLTEYGPASPPQLSVRLGERFVVETIDNLFDTVNKPGDVPRFDQPPIEARQYVRVNPLAGPVYVEGVEAGDTLVVEIEEIAVRDWGWTGTAEGAGLIAGLAEFAEIDEPFATILAHLPGPSGTLADGEAVMNLGREARWPLAPFIGTIVTAPERGIENSVVGQGPWGGNIDVRDVAAGNRIHMNSTNAGGLLFLGDVHASQADSELTGFADETAAEVTLSCGVLKGREVPGVCRIEKPDSLVQVDSARNSGTVERALNNCFLNMIRWLRDDYGVEPREAYLQMSANSRVRINIYQWTSGLFTCGVEFPKDCLTPTCE